MNVTARTFTARLRRLVEDRALHLSIVGLGWIVAYFAWGLLALQPTGLDLAAIAAGAIAGAAANIHLSRGHNELGLVPFGSIGLTLLPFAMVRGSSAGITPTTVLLLLLGAFAAWFTQPLCVLIRDRVGHDHLRFAAVAAAMGIGAGIAMGVHSGFAAIGIAGHQELRILGLMNAAVSLFIYRLLPEFLLRFLAWLLTHGLFRLEREGPDAVPMEGPALVTCNHVSFADAVILMAACARPIRFVMDHRIFRVPVLSFVFRESRAIPIASAREDPAMLEAAFEEIARALEAGEVVGIFPEGAITRDGEMQPFRPGLTRILARTPVPVVPMALSGLWGSIFSRRYTGLPRYLPKAIAPRIRLRRGAAIAAADATPDALRGLTLALRGDRR